MPPDTSEYMREYRGTPLAYDDRFRGFARREIVTMELLARRLLNSGLTRSLAMSMLMIGREGVTDGLDDGLDHERETLVAAYRRLAIAVLDHVEADLDPRSSRGPGE